MATTREASGSGTWAHNSVEPYNDDTLVQYKRALGKGQHRAALRIANQMKHQELIEQAQKLVSLSKLKRKN
jgi:hypothetical protein